MMIQILNFPKISDIAVYKTDDYSRKVYIDLNETDQLIVSNNITIDMLLDLENDPILIIKSSYKLVF